MIHPDVVQSHWADAASLDPSHVARVIAAAEAQCDAWAAPTTAREGESWTLAVILLARDIHNATRREGREQTVSDGELANAVRDLPRTIHHLLRPPRPRPAVG